MRVCLLVVLALCFSLCHVGYNGGFGFWLRVWCNMRMIVLLPAYVLVSHLAVCCTLYVPPHPHPHPHPLIHRGCCVTPLSATPTLSTKR